MNEQTRRSQNKNEASGFNGWKWAFIGLVALILGAFIYLTMAVQPVDVNEANTEQILHNEEPVVLSTSVNKEDAELMINTYLNEAIGEDYEDYRVALTDHLEVHGNIEVFGFEVPFSLYFKPYILENGNLQLRGESVELANFSLPVSAVMSLFTRQVNLPDFIAVDSEQQLIVINLNEMTEELSFDITVDRINLEEDEIELNLYLNRGTISDTIQSNQRNGTNE